MRVTILCVGNLLLRDEGVGIHVAKELMEMELPEDVRVVDGGTEGFGLLDVIWDSDKVIVVDAVRGGEPPGTLYRFKPEEVREKRDLKLSFHDLSLLDVLKICDFAGRKPETVVLGIEPKSLEMGMELSPEVASKVPRLIEMVLQEALGEGCGEKSPRR